MFVRSLLGCSNYYNHVTHQLLQPGFPPGEEKSLNFSDFVADLVNFFKIPVIYVLI